MSNLQSKRSNVLIPILREMKRIILISGTPMLARPEEIFNLLHIIRPDIFTNFMKFAARYCDPKKSRYGKDYSGACHIRELNYLITKHIMIRRLKKDVLTELPDKIR